MWRLRRRSPWRPALPRRLAQPAPNPVALAGSWRCHAPAATFQRVSAIRNHRRAWRALACFNIVMTFRWPTPCANTMASGTMVFHSCSLVSTCWHACTFYLFYCTSLRCTGSMSLPGLGGLLYTPGHAERKKGRKDREENSQTICLS